MIKKRIFSSLLLLLFGLVCHSLYGQFNSFQNLQRKLEKVYLRKPSKAVNLLKEALQYEPELHDTVTGKLWNQLGVSYAQLSRYDSAQYFFDQSLHKISGFPEVKAGVLKNKGIALRSSAQFQKSLETLEEALEVYCALDHKEGQAAVLSEMGSNYNYMLEAEQAIEVLQRSIAILESQKKDNSDLLNIIKQKLANSFFNNGSYDFANSIYQDILPHLKEKNRSNYLYTLLNSGDCYYYQGVFEKAIRAYEEAHEGLSSSGNMEFSYFALSKKARVLEALDQTAEASASYEKAVEGLFEEKSSRVTQVVCEYLDLLNESGSYNKAVQLISAYRKFTEVEGAQIKMNYREELEFLDQSYVAFKNSGSLREALAVSERYRKLNDSIVKVRNEERIAEIHAKYENEVHMERNASLLENVEVLNIEVKERERYLIFAVLIFLFLSPSVLFVFNRMKYKDRLRKLTIENFQNEKRILQNRHREEENKRREKEILIEAKEREMVASTMEVSDFQNRIKKLLAEDISDIQTFKKKLRRISEDKNYWKEFQTRFTEVHPKFFAEWTARYPNLTKNDLQFCSLVKIGLSNKEIASLLGIGHQSVITKKYRIKKKIGIKEDSDFNELFK